MGYKVAQMVVGSEVMEGGGEVIMDTSLAGGLVNLTVGLVFGLLGIAMEDGF
jgi:hypothetical protein